MSPAIAIALAYPLNFNLSAVMTTLSDGSRPDLRSGDGRLGSVLSTKKPRHDRSIVAGLPYYNQTD